MENSEETPKPTTNSGKRGKRGQQSAKKHDQNFRERTGAKVIKDIKSKIEQDTFADLDVAIQQIASLGITSQPVTVQLPVTTRGIGFLVNAAWREVRAVNKGRDPPITKNQLYRVTLAQLQLQLYQAKTHVTLTGQERLPASTCDFTDHSMEQAVITQRQTFRPLAAAVNSVGTLTHDGRQYLPHVPESTIVVTEAQPMEGVVAASTAGTESPAKRSRVEKRRFMPDPFVVTFNNLHATVQALANPQTPAVVRDYFRANNPIPGARFNDANILVNPAEVMPQHYSATQFRNELNFLRDAVSLCIGKGGHLIGTLSFTGRGMPSMLVSSYGHSVLDNEDMYWDMTDSPEDHYAFSPLSSQHIGLGILCRFGEQSGFPNSESRDLAHHVYALRSMPSQCVRAPLEWTALCDAALTRQ
ncbi:hypothetical protein R5R35_001081 [Gryllus longicercus]|uniref:Uncharacterized protein n=1 Tax=Gryllus longicercus TaxID=2509291 RepID=A0AAN9ZC10_9ORTH